MSEKHACRMDARPQWLANMLSSGILLNNLLPNASCAQNWHWQRWACNCLSSTLASAAGKRRILLETSMLSVIAAVLPKFYKDTFCDINEGSKTNTWPFPASSYPLTFSQYLYSDHKRLRCPGVWGTISETAQDANDLWQPPRQDLFVLQEHPDKDLRVISGPLKFGAASNCNSAGKLLPSPPLSPTHLHSAFPRPFPWSAWLALILDWVEKFDKQQSQISSYTASWTHSVHKCCWNPMVWFSFVIYTSFGHHLF